MIKYFTAAAVLLLSSQAHASYCSVPYTPFSGADYYAWQNYYRDLETYNRCMHRLYEEQQRQIQFQEQQRRNNNLFNSW